MYQQAVSIPNDADDTTIKTTYENNKDTNNTIKRDHTFRKALYDINI